MIARPIAEHERLLRIVIVERADVLRSRIATNLFAGTTRLQRAGAFSRGREALAWLRSGGAADIAIVGVSLPDGSASELVAMFKRLLPAISCVVLASRNDTAAFAAAIRGGAGGFVFEETPAAELPDALRAAAAGDAPLPATVVRGLLRDAWPAEPPAAESEALTDREREVLILLAKGLSYASIGALLGIRLGTVQHHIKRLYQKLEVNTKAEAAVAATRLGLV